MNAWIIFWKQIIPKGTSIKVETNVSLDGGQIWLGWKEAKLGEPIPDTFGVDLSNARLQIRQTLRTDDPTKSPALERSWVEYWDEDIKEKYKLGFQCFRLLMEDDPEAAISLLKKKTEENRRLQK